MSVFERARLFITRKKGKTLVMFCIFFVLATAIISGLSIKKAAQSAMQQARESVGGNFSLGVNYNDDNPNLKEEEVANAYGSGKRVINAGPPLSQSMAKEIGKVDGITSYNGTGTLMLEENGIKYVEANDTPSSIVGAKEIPNVQLSIDMNSKMDALFESGRVKLVEGRHIKDDDKHKVLVHKDLAEKNNWKLGDKVPLSIDESRKSRYGAEGDAKVDAEIVGMFETNKESQSQVYLPFMMPENNVIADVETGKTLVGKDEYDFETITFNVKDPKNMNDIVEKVKKLDIDWKQFTLNLNDEQYQNIAGSIEQLDEMVTTIMYAVFIVSCVILTLILSLWIKARIYETGVLLSLGISKGKIIAQYITELMMVAIVAFGLSYFSGTLVSQSIGDSLIASIQENQHSADSNNYAMSGDSIKTGGLGSSDSEKIEDLDVSVSPEEVIYVYAIGTSLIIISILLSSASVLRLKPKEILSKMS